MALHDNATLVVGAGNYFLAPVGTAAPTDLTKPGTGWDNLGHTSLEEILTLSSEGGEKTVLGTLQNKSLRTVYSTRTEAFSITLQQWDADSLKLYFGANMEPISTGSPFSGVPNNPRPTESAFMAVYIDGDTHFGLYIPRCEIFRGDDWELADTENLSGLPISITALTHESNAWNYALTPLKTTTPPAS